MSYNMSLQSAFKMIMLDLGICKITLYLLYERNGYVWSLMRSTNILEIKKLIMVIISVSKLYSN